MNNYTLTIYNTGSNKLNLVKAIKIFSNLRLKESKNIVDSVTINGKQIINSLCDNNQIKLTKEILNECVGCVWELNDVEKARNDKLTILGLGNREDMINLLVDFDMNRISTNIHLTNYKSLESIKEILKDRYVLISDENLKKSINECNL